MDVMITNKPVRARVPDAETADDLIAEKIGSGSWVEHAWKSDNWLVNASTIGLMMTGSILKVDSRAEKNPGEYFKQMAGRLGEPVIRTAVKRAMRILGEQFVLGRDIESAIKRGRGWKTYGKVKLLTLEDGTRLREASPSMAVRLSGLRETPSAGDGNHIAII